MLKICMRPLPESGESPEGYLRRLAVVNGYRTFSSFVREMFDGEVKSCRGLGYAAISGVTGHKTEQLKNIQLVKGHYSGYIYNDQVVRKHQLLRDDHYCPECVMESGYLKARWSLAWLPVCTTHHRRLVPLCNFCVQSLLAGSSSYCEKCAASPIDNTEVIERQRFLEERLENTQSAKKVISKVDEFYNLGRSAYYGFKRARVGYSFPQRGQVYFVRNETNAFELVRDLHQQLVA